MMVRVREPPLLPKRTAFLIDALLVVPAGTIGITLGITLILQWVGYLDSQFYRQRDEDDLPWIEEHTEHSTRDGRPSWDLADQTAPLILGWNRR